MLPPFSPLPINIVFFKTVPTSLSSVSQSASQQLLRVQQVKIWYYMIIMQSPVLKYFTLTYTCYGHKFIFAKFRNFKFIRKSEFGRLCLTFHLPQSFFLFYGFKMLKNILIFLQFCSVFRRKIPTVTATQSITSGMLTVGFCDNEDTISGSTRAGNYCNG